MAVNWNNNNINAQRAANCSIKNIKIISRNINSIQSLYKRNNLDIFLKKFKPDILALQETKLCSKHKVNFLNYNMYRSDRNSKGGGTAILISEKFKCNQVFLNHKFDVLECTVISLKLADKSNLFIISVYTSPALKCSIDSDLNAKHSDWRNLTSNGRGWQLKQWLDSHTINFSIDLLHSKSPTLYKAYSFIDIALIKSDIQTLHDFLNTIDTDSDHRAIELDIILPSEIETENCKINRFLYKKTNNVKFKKFLAEHSIDIPDNRNLSNTEIDAFIESMQTAIKGAIGSTPRYKQKDRFDSIQSKTITKLYKQKHITQSRLHRVQHRSDEESQQNYIRLKQEMKTIKKKLFAEFSKVAKHQWADLINGIDYRESANFFPKINTYFRKKDNSNKINSLLIREKHKDIMSNRQCNYHHGG
ncbi:hypothetical protein TKK_0002368 [Trichogramma kaykai]